MKWIQVKRDWLAVSQRIKLKWGKFSDQDLATISGDRESFISLYEQRYGGDRSTAEQKIESFVEELELPAQGSKLLSWSNHCWKNIKGLTRVRPRI